MLAVPKDAGAPEAEAAGVELVAQEVSAMVTAAAAAIPCRMRRAGRPAGERGAVKPWVRVMKLFLSMMLVGCRWGGCRQG
ncbi:hypothetical protein QN416_26105, partial [Glaciimonas sp. Cout2]|uniref:hypothetical protein n=1 Tax=Glaciimonas sp. Cout2 TaxID=3048621 RepID=UPI002B23CE03